MRILVDILHPKQAHFFRALINHWFTQGHEVKIVTRDKDITNQLLAGFGFSFTCISHQKKKWNLLFELIERWVKMFMLMRKFQPDFAISMAGLSTSLPAKLLSIPNIAITDTETATLQNLIGLPFADLILTPAWYLLDHGPRHKRYQGFHEWSYLHPKVFTPDPSPLKRAGVNPYEPYAVIRFVKWEAAHDWGESGFGPHERVELVHGLAKRMKVYLTSETDMPELQKFHVNLPVEHMHHMLAFAALHVGESPTMAAESSLLGTPSILASSWAGKCGNMQVLENEFELMQVFKQGKEALAAALSLAKDPSSSPRMQEKREQLLARLEYIPDVFDEYVNLLLGEKDG